MSDPLAAARAAWGTRQHLAVLSGPDAGWCHPVLPWPQSVGRAPGCALRLADPELSARHVEVRERAGRTEVRDLGSVNGTRWRRGAARFVRHRVGARWRAVPDGARLFVGGSVVEVRTRPGLVPDAGPEPAAAAPGGPPTDDDRRGPGLVPALLSVAWSLPLLLMAPLTGARLLLLVLPVAALTALLAPWLRRRSRSGGRRADPGAPDPAAVLLAAAAGRGIPAGEWPGGATALVGEPGPVRALARWLAGRAAAEGRTVRLAPRSPAEARAAWSWLEDDGTPAADLVVSDLLAGGPGRPAPTAALVLVRDLSEVPPACSKVVEVRPGGPNQVTAAWAMAVATGLCAGPPDRLPTAVTLAGLLPDPETAWPADDGALEATFAIGPSGPVAVDLAREGPHALVAGATGAGKSELLLAWVLALAHRYPPSALAVVAFDYKGGATFGPLAGLPHLAGLHTDLDAAGTARALASLRAELTARERRLATAGARDLEAYRLARRAPTDPAPPVGRLLVVVDEFRALADHHPDLMADLVRLAAQGRSLGMHLILATQRPGGAIGADLRANIHLRICLRVTGPGDSIDVLGHPRAASLAALPGRAILARSEEVEIQAAWLGPGGDGTARGLAEQVGRTATRLGERRAEPLAAPPLPTRAPAPRPAADGALPVLLLDPPGARALEPWSWRPADSPLLIAGGPGSGRSTALATLAAAALAAGLPVHLLGGRVAAILASRGSGGDGRHGTLGTVVGPEDPRRLLRLVDLLTDRPEPCLVCLDDADATLAAIPGADAPERLARARAGGLALAVAGPLSLLAARWATAAPHRLVLGALDPAGAALAGVPRRLVPENPPPGRAILLSRGRAVPGQVWLPNGAPAVAPVHPPVRLAPIPTVVHRADLDRPPREADRVPLGPGGDSAEPVRLRLPLGSRVAVIGPPESGRSTALWWLADALTARGRRVTRISAAGRRPAGPAASAAWDRFAAPEDEYGALVVDDVDRLPVEDAAWFEDRWCAPGGLVVAGARSDSVAAAFRGPVSRLREARSVVVLAPLRGGSGHLPASEVLSHADPAHPRAPGRGVLVEPRRIVPVQFPGPP